MEIKTDKEIVERGVYIKNKQWVAVDSLHVSRMFALILIHIILIKRVGLNIAATVVQE